MFYVVASLVLAVTHSEDLTTSKSIASTPNAIDVGSWGRLDFPLQVLTVVSDHQVLVQPLDPSGEHHWRPLMLKGVSMAGMVSDQKITFGECPFLAVGTYDYTGGLGTKRTVLLLDANEKKLRPLVEEYNRKKRLEAQDAAEAAEAFFHRYWTINERGKPTESIKARFVAYKKPLVSLKRDDNGKEITVHLVQPKQR
jgi:hypothetical protein